MRELYIFFRPQPTRPFLNSNPIPRIQRTDCCGGGGGRFVQGSVCILEGEERGGTVGGRFCMGVRG